jgi:hypothetical protein
MQFDDATHGDDALRDVGRVVGDTALYQLAQVGDGAEDVDVLVLEFVDVYVGPCWWWG